MEPDIRIQTVGIGKINTQHHKDVRADLDLEPLMADLERNGQKVPIHVDHYFELIDGKRRLEAMHKLGWCYCIIVVEDADHPNPLERPKVGDPYDDPDPAGLNDSF